MGQDLSCGALQTGINILSLSFSLSVKLYRSSQLIGFEMSGFHETAIAGMRRNK